jgi:hypothetical protein
MSLSESARLVLDTKFRDTEIIYTIENDNYDPGEIFTLTQFLVVARNGDDFTYNMFVYTRSNLDEDQSVYIYSFRKCVTSPILVQIPTYLSTAYLALILRIALELPEVIKKDNTMVIHHGTMGGPEVKYLLEHSTIDGAPYGKYRKYFTLRC